MPQTLALLHTSPTLSPMFNELCARILPGVRILHFVDESLIKNTIAAGLHDEPVIRVDAAMAEQAVSRGRKVGVLATLSTTLAPTVDLVRRKAAEAGRDIELVEHLCEGAFEAVMAGDGATHDRIVGEAITQSMRGVDAIVLAQASMARVVGALPPEAIPAPVFSSPELGVERARDVLRGLPSAQGLAA